MGFADRLATAPRPAPRNVIEKLLDTLDDAERAALLEMLRSDVPAAWVAEQITDETGGRYAPSASTVNNWRRTQK